MDVSEKVAENFWLEALATVVGKLDALKPLRTSGSGGDTEAQIALPAALVESLQRSTKNHPTAIFVFLVSAVQGVLQRYSGQTTLLIGAPPLERSDSNGLVFVLNQIDGAGSFKTLIGEQRQRVIEASRYQHYSLTTLYQKFIANYGNYEPIFDVGVMYDKLSPATEEFDLFKLQVRLSDDERGWSLRLRAKDGIIAAPVLAQFGEHLIRFLSAGFADPNVLLKDIALLTPDEIARVLAFGRGNAADVSASLVEQIREHAVYAGERTAVVWGEQLSYAELEARSNQFARMLAAAGVQPESRVMLIMPKSLDLPICLLGTWKAGAVYVPVAPELPAERLLALIADCDPDYLVVGQTVLEKLPFKTLAEHARAAGQRQVVLADDLEYLYTEESADAITTPLDQQSLAYIMYTSGTTGSFKGVAVSHSSLSNVISWFRRTYQLDAEAKLLQLTPVTFDPSLEQLLGALTAGGQIQLAGAAELANPDQLAARIEQQALGQLNATPAIVEELLAERERIPGLHTVIVGGDSLREDLKAKIIGKGYRLHNHYGPTECTIDVTAGACQAEQPVAIGHPIDNTRIYILNQTLQPQPPGVAGEIYVGGAGLARGYWRDPALTAELFVPDPFADGQRMFRTGDSASWTEDGAIMFGGRSSTLAKVRGVRINPAEIERVLSDNPRLKEAAVVAYHNAIGEESLCLFVGGTDYSESEITDLLLQRLPHTFIPSRIVLIERLPKLESGKIDAAQLRAQAQQLTVEAAYRAPETETEQIIAAIWADVLGVERVGVDTDFFALGGHSLMATRVIYRIYEEFGVDINLR
ncbi:MAG: non-ribosomal peptide synthetase, partial [Chloroflexi bacterium]|nr:non-ribosomal peptide synthetase [Chloroflexota bacterium]